MSEPVSYRAITVDLYEALHAYLGQRPTAETARLFLFLEGSPTCNLTVAPPVEVMAEVDASAMSDPNNKDIEM